MQYWKHIIKKGVNGMRRMIIGFISGCILMGMILSISLASTQQLNVSWFPVAFKINGKVKALDDAYTTFNHNGHVYVPVRFVSESMSAVISYDDTTETVDIQYMEPHETFSEQASLTVQDDFTLTIHSASSVYKSGELIRIWSTFAYGGDDDIVLGAQSTPFLGFYLIDEEGNYYEAPRFSMGFDRTMSKGSSFISNLNKNTIISYNEQFNSDPDLHPDMNQFLPSGTYTIGVIADYKLGDSISLLKAETSIRIERIK